MKIAIFYILACFQKFSFPTFVTICHQIEFHIQNKLPVATRKLIRNKMIFFRILRGHSKMTRRKWKKLNKQRHLIMSHNGSQKRPQTGPTYHIQSHRNCKWRFFWFPSNKFSPLITEMKWVIFSSPFSSQKSWFSCNSYFINHHESKIIPQLNYLTSVYSANQSGSFKLISLHSTLHAIIQKRNLNELKFFEM